MAMATALAQPIATSRRQLRADQSRDARADVTPTPEPGDTRFQSEIRMPEALLNLQTGGRRQFHPAIKLYFRDILRRAERTDDGRFTYQATASEDAERLGVSVKQIRAWRRFFIRRGWLRPLDSRGGRGRGAQFSIVWLEKAEAFYRQRSVERHEWRRIFAEDPHYRQLERAYLNAYLKQVSGKTYPQRPSSLKGDEIPCKDGPSPGGLHPLEEARTEGRDDTERWVRQVVDRLDGPRTAEDFEALTDVAADGMVLFRGGGHYRRMLGRFRRLAWRKGGATREESKIIVSVVARLIAEKPIGYARSLMRWLEEHIAAVLARLRKAWARGIRAAYRVVTAILKSRKISSPRNKGNRKAPTEGMRRWDFRTWEGIRDYLKVAEQIAEHGGGTCPRCGKFLPPEVEEEPDLAFKNPDKLCTCVWVARTRRTEMVLEAEWRRDAKLLGRDPGAYVESQWRRMEERGEWKRYKPPRAAPQHVERDRPLGRLEGG